MLSLLAVFGLYLNRGVRQKVAVARTLTFRDNLHYVANAGVQRAVVELLKDEEPQYDTLGESWSFNPAELANVRVGPGAFTVAHRTDGAEVYGIVDEERKINVNTAPLEVLTRLIERVAGLDEADARVLAAAVCDWRDGDSFLSLAIGSAEESYYQNLSEPYDCKDYPFEVEEELLLVKGMTEDIFLALKPSITIYGSGKVNINTASAPVLAAFGLGDGLIEKIMAFRAGADERAGTGDDNVFEPSHDVAASLSQFEALSSDEATILSAINERGDFCTASSHFRVVSTASIGPLTRTVEAVTDKKGTIVSWREW